MKLHYSVCGDGPDIIILHGVFGMSDNWRSVALALSDRYRIWTPDLRNHGRSPHSEPMGFDDMASDIREMMRANDIEEAVFLGHSMGGKLAMHLAMHHPGLCRIPVVVDITPGTTPFRDYAMLHMLRTFNPGDFGRRSDIETFFQSSGLATHVSGLMLKNIQRWEGRFHWKPNMPVLLDALPSIGAPLDGPAYEGKALFIFGSESDHYDAQSEMLIKTFFPGAGIRIIKGAGHWVHVDQPATLMKQLDQFLSSSGVL